MQRRAEPAEITFTVTERYVNIHFDGASVAQFGITNDDEGQPVLAFPNQFVLAALKMKDGSITGTDLRALHVTMVYLETEDDMSLPRYRRTQIVPQAPRTIRVRTTPGGVVDQRDVEAVVSEIITSLAAEPDQSPARRAAISREIAQRVGVPVMSVAGIRAAFTKNMYGNAVDLVAAAKKARA